MKESISDVSQRHQHIWKLARKEGKKLDCYRQMTSRRYLTPSGYISVEELAGRLSANLWCVKDVDWAALQNDFAQALAVVTTYRVCHSHAPVYWVDNKLLNLLEQTKLETTSLAEVKRVIPTGVVMFPSGKLLTPDGESVDGLIFDHRVEGELEPSFEHRGQIVEVLGAPFDTISWTVCTHSGTLYAGNLGVDGESLNVGEQHYPFNWKELVVTDDEAEYYFTNLVHQTLLKILLVMQVRPDLVEDGTLVRSRAMGFSSARLRPKKGSDELWTPYWVGRSLQEPRQPTPAEKQPKEEGREPSISRSSPRPHWRKGHLRRVVTGKRELGQRKWVWIQPKLINFTYEADTSLDLRSGSASVDRADTRFLD